MKRCLLLAALPALLCAVPVRAAAPAAAPAAAAPAAAKARPDPPAQSAAIPFGVNLRLTLRPTLLGLVPESDPLGFGTYFVRVARAAGNGIELYYEVKELVGEAAARDSAEAQTQGGEDDAAEQAPGEAAGQPQSAGDPRRPRLKLRSAEEILRDAQSGADGKTGAGAAPEPAPSADDFARLAEEDALSGSGKVLTLRDYGPFAAQTRIRRGTLSTPPLATGKASVETLLSAPGGSAEGLGSLWIPAGLFARLRSDGAVPLLEAIELASSAQASAALAAELQLRGGAAPADVELVLEQREAVYSCYVNGERRQLAALRCSDSAGIAEYYILDNADNPLLLKLSFSAPELAALAESPALSSGGAPGTDARRPRLALPHSRRGAGSSGSEPSARLASGPAADKDRAAPDGSGSALDREGYDLAALLASGSGFAVVTIDY